MTYPSEMTAYEVREYDFPRVTRDTTLLVGPSAIPMQPYFDRFEVKRRLLRNKSNWCKTP